MLAYQPYTSATTTGCGCLITADHCSQIEQWTSGRCHTLPNLPGRANDFTPYPFGRRRRRQ